MVRRLMHEIRAAGDAGYQSAYLIRMIIMS
jgi:hypothetical protein